MPENNKGKGSTSTYNGSSGRRMYRRVLQTDKNRGWLSLSLDRPVEFASVQRRMSALTIRHIHVQIDLVKDGVGSGARHRLPRGSGCGPHSSGAPTQQPYQLGIRAPRWLQRRCLAGLADEPFRECTRMLLGSKTWE